MNRETIKKYKEAFDWWLEGGKVWTRRTDGNEWVLIEEPSFRNSFIYVSDDEYAELRKAWYDGKKIQFKSEFTGKWITYKGLYEPEWGSRYIPKEWRIKSDEWYEELDGTKENGVICWVEWKGKRYVDLIVDYEDGLFFNQNGDDYIKAEPIKYSDLKDFQKDDK